MANGKIPSGVHIVGSSQFNTAQEAFTCLSEKLPQRLARIPDGEIARNKTFCDWQRHVFEPSPWLFSELALDSPEYDDAQKIAIRKETQKRLKALAEGNFDSRDIVLAPLSLADTALESWNAFVGVQSQGLIAKNVKFQVAIATPVNVVTRFVRTEFLELVEGIYAEKLKEAIQRLQAVIPPQCLAVQIDVGVDIAMLEGVLGYGNRSVFKPWFNPSLEAITTRILSVANTVQVPAELGFHLCYGDLGHKHFKEPEDLSLVVDLANALMSGLKRQVNFFHMPVPISRNDPEYFKPLSSLHSFPDMKLYLGLVHANDIEGSKKKIQLAGNVWKASFGISTECGWGRTPKDDIMSVLNIARELSFPISI